MHRVAVTKEYFFGDATQKHFLKFTLDVSDKQKVCLGFLKGKQNTFGHRIHRDVYTELDNLGNKT